MIRSLILLMLLSINSIAQYNLCDSVLIIPASAIGQAPFDWYVSTGQIDSAEQIDIRINTVGNYYIVLTTGAYGCSDKILQRFFVDTCREWTIYIPSGVTLRGINQSWFPKGYNITIDSFLIFNRWGEILVNDNKEWIPSNGPIRFPIDVYGFKVFFTIPGGIRLERYGRVTIID